MDKYMAVKDLFREMDEEDMSCWTLVPDDSGWRLTRKNTNAVLRALPGGAEIRIHHIGPPNRVIGGVEYKLVPV